MSLESDPPETGLPGEGLPTSGEEIARRKLLKQGVWVLPAIVSTVTVTARAAQATCTPTCSPTTACTPTRGCNPATCNPATCSPNGGLCGPTSCRPRR